jgi:release factor glutamine methyltransferase
VTLNQALALARKMLAVKMDIENPSLEAEILLRHALQISRVRLHLDLDKDLGPAKEQELRQMVERKIQGEPLAYITGYREFYGLDFYVDSRVLIPRPESELLVEEAIRFGETTKKTIPLFDKSFTIADIGTGSGAVAVSLAINWPLVGKDERNAREGSGALSDWSTREEPFRIFATDISASALRLPALIAKHRVIA